MVAVSLFAAAACLYGPSAMAQDRYSLAQSLNELFTAIYTNSGVMNGIFENCFDVPGAAGEFFNSVHNRIRPQRYRDRRYGPERSPQGHAQAG